MVSFLKRGLNLDAFQSKKIFLDVCLLYFYCGGFMVSGNIMDEGVEDSSNTPVLISAEWGRSLDALKEESKRLADH